VSIKPDIPIPARGKTRRNSPGFSLIELVVVLALLGIIGGAIAITLVRQQRFYRGASEILYAREGVRDAIEVLAIDIRGTSIADTVRLLADSAIEMFANIGSSVVCQSPDVMEVRLPEARSRGNTLTSLLTQPDTGDLALFHRDSTDIGAEWERHRIAGFSSLLSGASCQARTGFTSGGNATTGKGFVVTLADPLSRHVIPGAPVRFIRRGRYSLYRASDGEWYLGYRRCNALGASVCGAIQPLSGPYLGYSANPHLSGLLFEYFDVHGSRLDTNSSPLSLARVNVTARAESRQRLLIEGRSWTPADSGEVAIAVRNRT
jgi:prepilin-type N-terminal cleavage/methylation domain-containing protein